MPNSTRDLSGLPQVLTYSAAMTIGILAALAIQIWLSRGGFDLVGLWQDAFSTKALRLRTAGPWWAMAGAAFVASGAAAAALSRLPPPWRRFRLLRWVLGAGVILMLADIGHSAAAAPAEAGMAATVAASLTALGMAALMALCGAYFTVRR
jgi:hypothetical protein